MSSSLWLNAYSLGPTRRYYTRGVAELLDELREDDELRRTPQPVDKVAAEPINGS